MLQLEHFGEGLRNPYGNAKGRELWHAYGNDRTEGPDDQRLWVGRGTAARHGKQGLTVHVEVGNLYLYLLNHHDAAGRWHQVSDLMPGWKPTTYNRLRFWLKTPKGLRVRSDGGPNFHVGTYTRNKQERYAQETGNGHWYYHLNLFPGVWNLVEVDLHHPHHQRNEPTKEWGIVDSPTHNPAYWMADALTSFYLDAKEDAEGQNLKWYPANFYLDSVQFDRAPKTDPVALVYGVTAACDGKRKLQLSWSYNRLTPHERFDIGWSPKPITHAERVNIIRGSRDVGGPGDANYNGVTWTGFDNFKGYQAIYVSIKPQSSKLFRQIKIDLRTE